MPERTVELGSMFYIDEDGKGRRGGCGEKIKVHPDFVEKFDGLNHLAQPGDIPPVAAIAPEAVEAEQREVPTPPTARRSRSRKRDDGE